MIKIIIGGYCQGKLEYVHRQEQKTGEMIFDGAADDISRAEQYRILNRVHLLIRRLMDEQLDAELFLRQYISRHPDAVLICDEVGSGIIPLEKKDRLWREQVGRIMCSLVQEAGEVQRICCGIPQRLK